MAAKVLKIDEVVKGSPAAQAGLQKDDVIIGVNRDRVNSIAEMRKVLAAKPAIIAPHKLYAAMKASIC